MTPAPAPRLDADTRLAAAHDQVSCELDGQAVILGLDDGVYYGLDPVGATAWALLEAGPHTVAQLAHAVTGEFEVDDATARADLITLMGDMLARGLVELRPAE